MLWDFFRVERIEEDYNDYHPEQNANIQEIQKKSPGQWIQTQSLDIIWLNGIQRLSLQLLHLWGYYSLCLSFGHCLRISNQGILLQVILLSPSHVDKTTSPVQSCRPCWYQWRAPSAISSHPKLPRRLVPYAGWSNVSLHEGIQNIRCHGYPQHKPAEQSSVFVSKVATSPSNFEAFKLPFDLKFPKNPLGWIFKRTSFLFLGEDWFWEFF